MKKLLLYLSVLMLITSCSPIKRINKLAAKHPELMPKEKIIRDSTYIYKDKIREVPVLVKGDTTYIDVPIDCPDQDVALIENGKLKQQIKILNGRLTSVITNKPDTVIIHVKDTETTIISDKDKETVKPEKFIPKFYKITFWGFWGFVLLLLLYLYRKIRG